MLCSARGMQFRVTKVDVPMLLTLCGGWGVQCPEKSVTYYLNGPHNSISSLTLVSTTKNKLAFKVQQIV